MPSSLAQAGTSGLVEEAASSVGTRCQADRKRCKTLFIILRRQGGRDRHPGSRPVAS